MTSGRKMLRPEQQGHIDGLCAIYAVLNACKYLFRHVERTDQELFKVLCESVSDLFPRIVYDGTEVHGIMRLIDAACVWAKRVHNRKIVVTRPFERNEVSQVEIYASELAAYLRPADTSACAILGLGVPWNHWTVATRASAETIHFFDSWGLPAIVPPTFFTFEKRLAGPGDDDPTFLVQGQTFILTRQAA